MEAITIYNKTISVKILDGIIAKIKEKRELVHLDDAVCIGHITRYFMMHGKALTKLGEATDFASIQRSTEVDSVVKTVRESIRLTYGLYQTPDIGRIGHLLDKLEKELKDKPIGQTKETHDHILRLNRSTAERLPFYSKFFEDIFAVTGRPASVLDLACGLNPMTWPYHQLRDIQYTACELNEPDVRHLRHYLNIVRPYTGIKGKAVKLDLTKDAVDAFSADVCFLFKVLDLLDPKITERIITTLRSRWIVASFPTKTITARAMRFKRRAGFQKMLRRLGMHYQTLTYENELVYIMEKGADHD